MDSVRPIRIVVADGQPLFVLGVRALLAGESSIQLVGEATNGREALDVVAREHPDLMLLDLSLEGLSGLEVLTRIAALKLTTHVVVVTTAIQGPELRTALVRGARGVLLKHMAGDLLTKCIRQVMKGEYWIGRDNVADLVHALRNPSGTDENTSVLSHREKDIVSAVLRGASNKDIAWQLGLGEQTVKNHLRRIFAKLHVSNRVELAIRAMEQQIH